MKRLQDLDLDKQLLTTLDELQINDLFRIEEAGVGEFISLLSAKKKKKKLFMKKVYSCVLAEIPLCVFFFFCW